MKWKDEEGGTEAKVFFSPSSVAIIGASRQEGAVGHEVVKNLIKCGYPGKIFPVNPKADKILGLKCYSSVLEIDEDVDLGVIAVPARIVVQVAEEAGEKGLKGLIVISAGFKEIGLEGARRERELVNVCKKYGMRLLGPNCLGLINTSTPINASFAPQMPRRGGIAFASQSGALCTAILDWAVREGVGFSNLISLGNMADMDETDFMKLLAQDPATKVILIYVEGIKDGRKFLEVSPKVSKFKPVIILKSGVSDAGAKAAASHTGSIAGSKVAYEVAFKKCGVLQVTSIEELFNLGIAFASQPLPQGRNVSIITNAGGPSIVAADACFKYGLNMAWLSPNTVEKLRSKLPEEASWTNPIDVLGDAPAERYKFALEAVLSDSYVDCVIVILTPQAMTQPLQTAKYIVELNSKFSKKPIFAVFMGGEKIEEAVKFLKDSGIPVFSSPEDAASTLAGMAKYCDVLSRTVEEKFPNFDVDRETVRRIIERAKRERRASLLSVEARRVVQAYGIQVPESELAQNVRQAVEVARRIGYPVAMKVVSPQILHKTDIGGVKLNLKSDRDVISAFHEIMRNANLLMPEARIFGVEVQKMVPSGREMIVGMNRDVQFGPLIMFGLGGIYVNILKDVSFRLAPLSIQDALEMITETKAYALLRGLRGEPPADIDAVVDTILRMSQLSTDFEEISEIDINPLFVYERNKGALALDVKITVT
ncbi:CoA-binding protein [Candidatus Bathyarchaeota archaeon]|nr:MAG: CoA-binding protein [Candidatus Bathyarchaeota archaeon]